jgi:uncharacterized protein (DUF2267 family)
VKYDEFIKHVSERAEVSREEARSAALTALEVLGERIEVGEAADLASQMPDELAEPLRRSSGTGEPFTASAFVERVADREGIAPNDADKRVRAVFATLQEAVTGGELEHVLAQLPTDYLELMGGTHRP